MTTDKTAVRQNTNDPLVGRWFHSIITEDDGCAVVRWQGQVIDRVHPNMYLLQLYEWGFGDPGNQTLVAAGDMAGWLFYASHEDMFAKYDRELRKRVEAHTGHKAAQA